ncbi:pyruvate, water dikinase regulatory protein [Oceanomicrobium pacificus]|uniref:Pyruvate, phosphate dikinase/phosphoenolpyruvate synthase regulator n=1 Tax=Oceanomicrobium pacificus TaxID=2692916 RepID=A0A6B0TLF0_9RHOB|nr:pyruvate, water dikinase regulatory protein [Oceanomicrobium pacificus]MXU64716.1 pyruvate, phosphate dikinase/phosphoenolpyruvate synthase regulator [Oceanomicrobium pacificus]
MPQSLHVLVLSDSTADTAQSAARAALSQFGVEAPNLSVHRFIRHGSQVDAALAETPLDLVLYTLVDPVLIDRIETGARQRGIRTVALLDPILEALTDLTGNLPRARPGQQYKVDRGYLDRVKALDYAMSSDDGTRSDRLATADVILVGVSRTSKTPTCIYLAYQGVRAANVPLVPGQPVPPALLDAIAVGVPVIGLTASPTRLVQVRQNRLQALGETAIDTYADRAGIQEELANARLFFERHDLPVVDVTRRSIEETAAAIRGELHKRKSRS